MDLTVPPTTASELAAAYLQATVTFGLAVLCLFLYQRYRKRYFAYWALAWALFALRLGAIISFLTTGDSLWLYWHQVTTGWTALALLWAALVFSLQLPWRRQYGALLLFPPLWSYLAIYRLDNFLLAAGPAVLFMSVATMCTGWVFLRHHRHAASAAALFLAVSFFLWGLHHLDYPFLRARGAWNPWGYYLDILFVLAMGGGILVLVLEDLQRGLGTLSALARDLQQISQGGESDVIARLLQRPLTLSGVRGTSIYMLEGGRGRIVDGAGVCADWTGTEPTGPAARAVAGAMERGQPEIVHSRSDGLFSREAPYAYAAALPVFKGTTVRGALIIVGDVRDPFAALDERFLVTLGQQVGAALESADLYSRLEARTAQLEQLAGRMVAQHEEERRRLSRELHDETAQVFSAVKLQLGVLRESATQSVAERLDSALALVDEGIRSIRNVTNHLRPALLEDLGLLTALRALVNEFAERSGIATRVDTPQTLPDLSKNAELALFRALQEGLANVTRHAEASSVTVRISSGDDAVTLELSDDGRGLPGGASWSLESGAHMGLSGMRERIHSLGGTLSLAEGAGGGVRLVVRLAVGSDKRNE